MMFLSNWAILLLDFSKFLNSVCIIYSNISSSLPSDSNQTYFTQLDIVRRFTDTLFIFFSCFIFSLNYGLVNFNYLVLRFTIFPSKFCSDKSMQWIFHLWYWICSKIHLYWHKLGKIIAPKHTHIHMHTHSWRLQAFKHSSRL